MTDLSQLSDEEAIDARLAILVDGFYPESSFIKPGGILQGEKPCGDDAGYARVVRYTQSLDECAKIEAGLVYKPESVIGRSTRCEYEKELHRICGGWRQAITATARQRAEALIATLQP